MSNLFSFFVALAFVCMVYERAVSYFFLLFVALALVCVLFGYWWLGSLLWGFAKLFLFIAAILFVLQMFGLFKPPTPPSED